MAKIDANLLQQSANEEQETIKIPLFSSGENNNDNLKN